MFYNYPFLCRILYIWINIRGGGHRLEIYDNVKTAVKRRFKEEDTDFYKKGTEGLTSLYNNCLSPKGLCVKKVYG
jgi:hypothetical protein